MDNRSKDIFSKLSDLSFQKQFVFSAICCQKATPYFQYYLDRSNSENNEFRLNDIILTIVTSHFVEENRRLNFEEFEILIPQIDPGILIEQMAWYVFTAVEYLQEFLILKNTKSLELIIELLRNPTSMYIDDGLDLYIESIRLEIEQKILNEFDIKKEHHRLIEELWAFYPYHFIEEHPFSQEEYSFQESLIDSLSRCETKFTGIHEMHDFINQTEYKPPIDLELSPSYADIIKQEYPDLVDDYMEYFRRGVHQKIG